MMRVMRLLPLLLLLPFTAPAQVEHVPVQHPVYAFLQTMHIQGRLPGWSATMLPLDRAAVTGCLRELLAHPQGLTESEAALLARLSDEFVAEADGSQRRVALLDPAPGAGLLAGLFDDVEKHLYHWADAERRSTFVMEFLGSADARLGRIDGGERTVLLGQVGGRFRGTIGGAFGYQLQSTNGEAFGDKALALMDRDLRLNTNFGDLNRNFFDVTEAAVSALWSWGSASLGRETVLSGVGVAARTLLSGNAPAFDAVRLNLHTGDLRFTFLHGALLGVHDTIENGRPWFDAKYIAMHRLEADLFRTLRVGVYEAVIYSQRAIDPAYINPVNFFKSAEHAGGDRDNPMLGIDLQTLSLPGTQVFASWLIDDVDFSQWGTGFYGNKFAWQAGLLNASLPNTLLGMEYGRVEPYTFTHVYRNNEYTNKGEAIGLDLPPNADRWTVTAQHSIGARVRITAALWRQRHGRNERDAGGRLVRNHGGDIAERFESGRDNPTAGFLDGPRVTSWSATLGVTWEPLRNNLLRLTWRWYRMDDEEAALVREEQVLSLRFEMDL